MSKKKGGKKGEEEFVDEYDTEGMAPKWKFSKSKAHPAIGVSGNGQVVTKKDKESHRVAVAAKEWKSGKHYWHFTITKMAPSEECSIGVCSKSGYGDVNLDVVLGLDKNSWCYCSNGCCYHMNKIVGEAEPFKQGDKVGVLLNVKNGTIEFFKNGIKAKVLVQIKKHEVRKPFMPAVSLHGEGTTVRVNTNAIDPTAAH
mmetsp:Transcript_4687/g.5086  ORF Transcript_4687/g.5086 Transcript_4687/m.5086 type:complete len:199 (-) Transcript_4687:65-661(-)|eukprot:CAMPEP_0168533874 /NCGR_PEP_ID=MMETSP0405-20121227/17446_1 /TAXON_ID=498012 /ORGANISM="Trichosphaerium sp, Strain Am-I-7 wt" /LENGTH=198 /DNA_ID=CAMNT_0008560237 /DNA_START=38 /DNA_END=634 /DNA_ORIENTATION=-